MPTVKSSRRPWHELHNFVLSGGIGVIVIGGIILGVVVPTTPPAELGTNGWFRAAIVIIGVGVVAMVVSVVLVIRHHRARPPDAAVAPATEAPGARIINRPGGEMQMDQADFGPSDRPDIDNAGSLKTTRTIHRGNHPRRRDQGDGG